MNKFCENSKLGIYDKKRVLISVAEEVCLSCLVHGDL